MKKLLTILLTLVMIVCLVNLNGSNSKAEDNDDENYLCLTSEENNSTVSRIHSGIKEYNLEYSKNGGSWTTWSDSDEITLNLGDKLRVRGTNSGFSTGSGDFINIRIAKGKIAVSGTVMALIDNGTGTATAIPNNGCFYCLFQNSTSITSISENLLPSTSLTQNCYQQMFSGCTGLKNIPEKLLPAEQLKTGCYLGMFQGCTGLVALPGKLLKSTSLDTQCYQQMFQDCTNLLSVTDLPATTLKNNCYQAMFLACSKLKLNTNNTGLKPFKINASGAGVTTPTLNMFSGGITNPVPGTQYYFDSTDLYNSITSEIEPQNYTGTEIKPKITITHGDATFYTHQPVEGVDYTVEYKDNVNPGTATVVITAKGSTYTGSKTINFEILSPTPSPSKKDESCEKVIGPTWHWNNDKGICEDYGVVGTSTR